MNANAKVMRIMVRNRQETGLLDVKMASYQHSYHTILHERFCLAVTSDVIKKKTACIFLFCNYRGHAPCVGDPSHALALARAGPWLACVRMAWQAGAGPRARRLARR